MAWVKPKPQEKETVHLFNKDCKSLSLRLVEDFLNNLTQVKVTRLGDTRILIENVNKMNYNILVLEEKHAGQVAR
jgi:hypothetical protein